VTDCEHLDPDEATLLLEASRTLRLWTQGDLRHDELTTPIRFAPASDGRLIASVTPNMLQAADCALALPDEHAPAMELAITLEEFEALGGAEANSDRWRIYHGEPPHSRWAMIEFDVIRFQNTILDGPSLKKPNPLASMEPRLCGLLNREHRDEVRSVMQHELNLEPDDPRVVGIDPLGLDIRNRFSVVRIDLDTPIKDPAIAEVELLNRIRASRPRK
jgi:hypothetical protein